MDIVTKILIGCLVATLLYGVTLEALAMLTELSIISPSQRWLPFLIVALTWGAITSLQMAGLL